MKKIEKMMLQGVEQCFYFSQKDGITVFVMQSDENRYISEPFW